MSMNEAPAMKQAATCAPSSLMREPLSEPEATILAGILKALADPVRLRLVSLIAAHEGGEVCACELVGPLDRSQPTISHHLKILREAGILESDRRATWIYYRIVPGALAQLTDLLVPFSVGAR
jgi:ArsR family transcriptional regulator